MHVYCREYVCMCICLLAYKSHRFYVCECVYETACLCSFVSEYEYVSMKLLEMISSLLT